MTFWDWLLSAVLGISAAWLLGLVVAIPFLAWNSLAPKPRKRTRHA